MTNQMMGSLTLEFHLEAGHFLEGMNWLSSAGKGMSVQTDLRAVMVTRARERAVKGPSRVSVTEGRYTAVVSDW